MCSPRRRLIKEHVGCSGRLLACVLNRVEAQSARWCAVVSVWSGHAQQRTLLWLGHPPLGLDMFCPSRLDVAYYVKVCGTCISRIGKPLGWHVEVLVNSTLLGANPSKLRVRLHPVYLVTPKHICQVLSNEVVAGGGEAK